MDALSSRWLAVDPSPNSGTTAAMRSRQAPHPEAVVLDGRKDVDQIRFVQELARHLHWLECGSNHGTGATTPSPPNWEAFCRHPDLTAEAIAAFAAAETGDHDWSEAQRAWLGRPHFALLLAFIRLLRHQRALLNAVPTRQLQHYYAEQLGFTPRSAEPDRVTVAFTLAASAAPVLLKAGTVLRAGVDATGQARLYRTLTEVSLNHVQVCRLRAIQLDRACTTLATIEEEAPDPEVRLDHMLRLAYGDDGVSQNGEAPCAPPSAQALSTGEIPALLACCAIPPATARRGVSATRSTDAAQQLPMEPREFLGMMRLVRQRCDAESDQEWAAINTWLGLDDLFSRGVLKDPRDFQSNVLVSLLGPGHHGVDWKRDGLTEINAIEDFYHNLDVPEVRERLKTLFSGTTAWTPTLEGATVEDKLDTFVRLMTMKLHIDAQWQQVNWLLERCGRRRRRSPSWRLDATTPNSPSPDFARHLARALDLPAASDFPWPVPLGSWPSPPRPAIPAGCWHVFLALEALEARFGLPLEGVRELSALATAVVDGQGRVSLWSAIQSLLTRAHEERWAARRRAALARSRKDVRPVASFVATLRQALRGVESRVLEMTGETAPSSAPLTAATCLERLSPWLPPGGREALERFGALLKAPGTAPRRLSWPEVDALLERAQRSANGQTPPPLEREDWRLLHGTEQRIQPEAMAAGQPLAPCFQTGDRATAFPASASAPAAAPAFGPGFAVASRLLLLSEGVRTIALCLQFTRESGNPADLLASLPAAPGQTLQLGACAGLPPKGPDQPGWGMNQVLQVEASTAAGWLVLPLKTACLEAAATANASQWSLTLTLELQANDPPLVALEAGALPRLRFRLRPWKATGLAGSHWRGWGGFDGLRVAGAGVRVTVSGLKTLRLQQDGVVLEAREPFTPFGSRPVVGSCLYISHPELVDGDLETITFAGTWKGLPDDLETHYKDYKDLARLPRDTKAWISQFTVDVSLRQRNDGSLVASNGMRLFDAERADGLTLHLTCSSPQPPPRSASVEESEADLREQERVWCWRLTPLDFGHELYPAMVARRARELALAISGLAGRQALALALTMKELTMKETATGVPPTTPQARYEAALATAGAEEVKPEAYTLPEPYTPLLEDLRVSYTRGQNVATAQGERGLLSRVHLFGDEEPLLLPPPDDDGVVADAPLLLPSHPHPGELWLELVGAQSGQPIALAFQLAEGSARGERPVEAVRWEVGEGWRWRPLVVREDGTDGLLHSGLLRFVLPSEAQEEAVSPLQAKRLWIRALLTAPVEAYATILAIQSQAVEAEAILPTSQAVLPPHGITGLEEHVPEIRAIHQPFSSRAGRLLETAAELRIRVAERLRHKDRALAGWDYERLLWEAFPSQLHSVVCLPAREERGVEVVVIPNVREQVPRNLFAPGAPADQLAAMEGHLRERCPAEQAPLVRNARYMPVTVRMWVCLREGVDPSYAQRELEETVIRVLSPWCFEASAEARLGGEVRAIDVVEAVEGLPFVAYLERLRLFLVDPGGRPLRLEGVETSGTERLAAPSPDVVLIAAPRHAIEFVSASTPLSSLIGIGSLRVGLDFQVA